MDKNSLHTTGVGFAHPIVCVVQTYYTYTTRWPAHTIPCIPVNFSWIFYMCLEANDLFLFIIVLFQVPRDSLHSLGFVSGCQLYCTIILLSCDSCEGSGFLSIIVLGIPGFCVFYYNFPTHTLIPSYCPTIVLGIPPGSLRQWRKRFFLIEGSCHVWVVQLTCSR